MDLSTAKYGVVCYAHPITTKQLEEMLHQDMEAYLPARLSKRAIEEGAFVSELNKDKEKSSGIYFTTSAGESAEEPSVYGVGYSGNFCELPANTEDTGLRISIHPRYVKDSCIVKTAKKERRTTRYSATGLNTSPYFSSGMMVEVGGIKYIWLNHKACQKGEADSMDLVSVDSVAKAPSFGKKNANTDFCNAIELQKKCDEVALENCSEEELELMQRVRLSRDDNYQSWTPVLEPKEKKLKKEQKKKRDIKLELEERVPNLAKKDKSKEGKEKFKTVKSIYKGVRKRKLTPEEGRNKLLEEFENIQKSYQNEEEQVLLLSSFITDMELASKGLKREINPITPKQFKNEKEEVHVDIPLQIEN